MPANNHQSRGKRAKTILVRAKGCWHVATRWLRTDPAQGEPACWVVHHTFMDTDYGGSMEKCFVAALADWRVLTEARRAMSTQSIARERAWNKDHNHG